MGRDLENNLGAELGPKFKPLSPILLPDVCSSMVSHGTLCPFFLGEEGELLDVCSALGARPLWQSLWSY